jgi:hypothetical protein
MDQNELRPRNRRVGLSVLAGMALMAALTTAYALATMPYRRQVDAVQPDARPMKTDLIIVLGLAAAATAVGMLVYRWLVRKPK